MMSPLLLSQPERSGESQAEEGRRKKGSRERERERESEASQTKEEEAEEELLTEQAEWVMENLNIISSDVHGVMVLETVQGVVSRSFWVLSGSVLSWWSPPILRLVSLAGERLCHCFLSYLIKVSVVVEQKADDVVFITYEEALSHSRAHHSQPHVAFSLGFMDKKCTNMSLCCCFMLLRRVRACDDPSSGTLCGVTKGDCGARSLQLLLSGFRLIPDFSPDD
ncbi:hypothetical protein DNTS_033813 [Danionella cerebrum]|uniref:Uncharacterized protein n=1 Tax=Danionella cerebrum TaxID=2873325 RepID=A0A553ML84_9TELE|nr:hypothetical protein DNTS_033813 [Danionella translucida]